MHTTFKKETTEYLLKLTSMSVNGNEIFYNHTVFLCETATYCIVCFFVRKIVTAPLFFWFHSNIMHLTDIVSSGKLNHLIKFLMVSLEMIVVRVFFGA